MLYERCYGLLIQRMRCVGGRERRRRSKIPMRTAEILFKGRPAGTLAETVGGGTRFTYAADWAEDIACCFPVQRREHEWRQGLHPVFQHISPEGWLREQQARAGHIAIDDDLGLLLRYGADCIGAVSIAAPDAPANVASLVEATASPGRTLSGIQKKLLVVRDAKTGVCHAAGPDGPAPYIAKFNSPGIDTLVRNEALSLRWAAAVLGKGEVNAAMLASIQPLDEMALVVTRFDRGPKGEKLRMEDFAQILCKPKGQGSNGKYEAAYEDIASVIRKNSSRPSIDLARFFKRLVAFALIGNCDAHLKNFSMVETSSGLRLSPAYDIVNTVMYSRFDQALALSINGRNVQFSAVTRKFLEDFGTGIGLPARAVAQIFADLGRQAPKADVILAPPPAEPPDGFRSRFQDIARESCLRLLGA